MRRLSPDEQALWARVAATIRPLSGTAVPPLEQPRDLPRTRPPKTSAPPPAAPAARRPRGVGETLDATWDRRLRSGAIAPDRTVDLHGMNLDRAWQAIDDSLDRAIQRGERLLLLITGHHRPGDPPIVRGRIRAAVHDWLAVSRHASAIAAVRGAHPRHGGAGSLYLVLRRR